MILKFIKENKLLNNSYFISFFLGSLLVLAFAPFDCFFVAIISMSGFYYILEKRATSCKQAFLFGLTFGFGFFFFGTYWIAISLLVDAGSFAWLIPFSITLIPLILAIFIALGTVSYFYFTKKFSIKYSYQKIIIFSICWIFFEFVRSHIFTGFPWNLLGYIWLFNINLAQIANIIGIYGLSFFAVAITTLPILFIRNTKNDKIFAIFLITSLLASYIYGVLYIKNNQEKKNLKIRVVQGNIKQEMKWDDLQKYKNFFKHIDLTNSSSLEDVDAVIWSETAIPYVISNNNEELLKELRKATPKNGVLVSGALNAKYFTKEKFDISNIYNSVVTLNKSGIVNIYNKHHLVPFGEYVPLQKYLPFVQKITNGAMGFSSGDGPKTVKAKNLSFSPLICYEVIFSDKIIEKNTKPDLLVNVTNDAWFGSSIGPHQHLNIARMRAIENKTPLIRAANTGISAAIDKFGRVIKKIDLNQEGVFDVSI